MSARLSVVTTFWEGQAHVAVAGDLDYGTGPRLRAALRACLDHRPRQIIVDLVDVSFCDCTGLNILLQTHAQARHDDIVMRVNEASAQVIRLFQLTGTEALFGLAEAA